MAARSPHLATLMIASGLSVLSLNMFLPSLPQIARDFDVGFATASWAVSGYLALTAVLQLLAGPISDRVGRRPVVLFSFAAFAILSACCALAQSFEWFLAARMLQGVIISCSTMALASVRDTSDVGDAAQRISWVSMGMAVGPMIGPAIGGLLDAAFGWRATFWFLSAGGAILFIVALIDWTETNLNRTSSFGAQFRAYPTLLASGTFWSFAGVAVCGIGCFFIFISGAPLVADKVLNISTAELGIAIGIITMGYFFGNAVSARITKRVGLGPMVVAGRALQVAAITTNLILLAVGVFDPLSFFGLMSLVGFGNGLANPSAQTGLMSVNSALSGSAAGLAGALVLAFGAVFTALSARLIEAGPPAATLLFTMLAVAFVGLLCALSAYRLSNAASSASKT
ncbi:MAG: MFS transporter [Rhodobacteraceae bacterium]|nr:MFS transporter [Paracoccaceae bacterium]